ncbi:nuclear transport factor 2 family protein [Saccharothrix deserti]|uniref:nuclear transport factor 2 family protein n=1 Tax=Saccharothrix deserti TaxID=2593674 RepID=UPI00192E3A9A|nr:nuclear transport factor 2 family protein [Saccharothrix deserti]
MAGTLDNDLISQFVGDWYRALDEHATEEEVLGYLVDTNPEMTFPEGKLTSVEEFLGWYRTVVNRFFDEVHEVTEVKSSIRGDVADVKVRVNWQARIWNPPAPTSQWLGFDADQTWQVVRDDAGRLRIRSYVVDALHPMPGSAEL